MADTALHFSASHAKDAVFEGAGLRACFEYRDLGIREATGGRVLAHVIRARPGADPGFGWHLHRLDFQMFYVLKGWVRFRYAGIGEVLCEAGSCVHQPPGIVHEELGHSDDLELPRGDLAGRVRNARRSTGRAAMSQARDVPPFRADHVGSLIRPRALIEARDKANAGTLPRDALRALEDAAIRDVIAMQERVGLQSITDGELRRNNWRDNFFESVAGFSAAKTESSFIFTEYSGATRRGMPVPVVTGRLERRKSITADDFAFTRALTRRTAKATLPSPTVNHFFSGDRGLQGSPYRDRRDFFADVTAIYRAEIADLARRGCTYLQIDEVPIAVLCDPRNRDIVRARGEDPDALIADYVAAINDAVRDRPPGMTICVHLCRGNQGHGQASGGYDAVAEHLFQELAVDGFFLEYDTERAGGFAPLRLVPKDKLVVLGIISTKLAALEPKDVVKRRIDEAGRMIDPARLCLSPQCGFASSYQTDRFTASDQERKLAHVVEIAREVWG